MKTNWKPFATILLVGTFSLVAIGMMPGPMAGADVRRPAQQKAFLSGSERSAVVLQEISQTLRSIDARLARLERLAEGKARVIHGLPKDGSRQ